MNLIELKKALLTIENVAFELENGTKIPSHFHITEVGIITKKFIDCGGTIREEKIINLQLWTANDFEHRLLPNKLLNIIQLSEDKLGIENLNIEVEYQTQTISKFGLKFNGNFFILTNTTTACLAEDKCGIPTEKLPIACCTPNGNCC